MTDFDLYIAKTQARLAFFLIIILVLLSFGVVALMLWPNVHPQQEIVGLIVQVVTGVLALCGSAIAYFFARHRPATAADNERPHQGSLKRSHYHKYRRHSIRTGRRRPFSPTLQEKKP